jgi:hypothetical protein
MEEPLAELAGYSRGGSQVLDTDLVRLTAAARTAGHRWDAIAAACDNGPGQDIPGVIRQQYWISPAVGPGPLFSATQRAARNLAGHEPGCYRPLTWPCPGCGHQVTDLAPRRTAGPRRARPRGGLHPAGPRPGRRRRPAARVAAPADPVLRRPDRLPAAALAGRADHR